MDSTKTLRHLDLLGAAIIVAILLVSVVALLEDRRNTWDNAERTTGNLLLTLEEDASRAVHLYDLSLQGVMRGLELAVDHPSSPEVLHQLLFDRAATAEYLGSMLVLDERGNIVHDSGSTVPRPGNFADRDYFQVHRDRPDVGLYLSKPYKSRLRDNDESIALSRRLSHADGSFAGVVMGAMRLAYFKQKYEQLSVGTRGAITLLRADGIVLMRDPYDPSFIGMDLGNTPNSLRMRREGSGSFTGRATLDGVQRLYLFKHVGELPLLMTIALSTDDVLAPWRNRLKLFVPLVLALCAAIVVLMASFRRQLRLRREAEAELQAIARTDGLTGIWNRRYFDEAIAREWASGQRDHQPITLLFLDVDHFKRYNDHYGHQAGDMVLKSLAQVLRAAVGRPRDLTARYGGEEFVILLPHTSLPESLPLAEKICAAVAELRIPHLHGVGGMITISAGAASAVPGSEASYTDLVERADAALYRAKSEGRNRVVMAGLNRDAPLVCNTVLPVAS